MYTDLNAVLPWDTMVVTADSGIKNGQTIMKCNFIPFIMFRNGQVANTKWIFQTQQK